jgi:hypothetical protein
MDRKVPGLLSLWPCKAGGYLLAGPERRYQGTYALKEEKGKPHLIFALRITLFRNVQWARDRFSLLSKGC